MAAIKIINKLTNPSDFAKLLRSLVYRYHKIKHKYFLGVFEKNLFKKFQDAVGSINKPKTDETEYGIEGSVNHEVKLVLEKADKLLDNEFEIFPEYFVNLKPVEWHTDFFSNFRWEPGTFYLDYDQESPDNNSDVKIPRELSRSHHLITLALAFGITKDRKYLDHLEYLTWDWIENNPFMNSINWGCAMDVAIRAVNWIWAFQLIGNENLTNIGGYRNIQYCLFQHGYFIYHNLEKAEANNHNHYLGNLVGLIYLGLYFRGSKEGNNWLEMGVKEFYREIRMQVLPSGISYERSINYNRLIVEYLTSIVVLLRKHSIEIPLDIEYRLETMFSFILNSIKPDGNVPIIGDQDDGRLHPFGYYNNLDYSYLLSIGAILFSNPEFKHFGNGFNLDCEVLFGESGKKIFEMLPSTDPKLHSIAYKDAGFFILRNEKSFMFVNNSGKGRYPELNMGGTHTHSDLLSFELCLSGVTFLVDPGSYIYSGKAVERMHFRSTKMHNTVTVDDMDQFSLRKEMLWDFKRDAITKLVMWESTEEYDVFVGEHSGYLRLDDPVLHRRKIEFHKIENLFVFEDIFEGDGIHKIESNFIFDTDVELQVYNTTIVAYKSGKVFNICFEDDMDFEITVSTCFISKAYRNKVESKKVSVLKKCKLPITFRFKILEDRNEASAKKFQK